MKRALVLWLSVTLVACESANMVSDVPDANGRCGVVPTEGRCVGSVLEECSYDGVLTTNCATISRGDGGVCAYVEGLGSYTCAVENGETCRLVTPHGDHTHIRYLSCSEPGAGCLIGPAGGTCVASVGSCTGMDVGRCMGDRLVLDCRAGQPIVYPCSEWRGRCDPAVGACVDIPETGVCEGALRRCATGLRCQTSRNSTIGQCVPDV